MIFTAAYSFEGFRKILSTSSNIKDIVPVEIAEEFRKHGVWVAG